MVNMCKEFIYVFENDSPDRVYIICPVRAVMKISSRCVCAIISRQEIEQP